MRPLALVIALLGVTLLAAGFFVDAVGVQTFPWTLLVFGIAAAGLGYVVARLFRLSGVDLGVMVVVGIVACVFALPAALYYAVAAIIG